MWDRFSVYRWDITLFLVYGCYRSFFYTCGTCLHLRDRVWFLLYRCEIYTPYRPAIASPRIHPSLCFSSTRPPSTIFLYEGRISLSPIHPLPVSSYTPVIAFACMSPLLALSVYARHRSSLDHSISSTTCLSSSAVGRTYLVVTSDMPGTR